MKVYARKRSQPQPKASLQTSLLAPLTLVNRAVQASPLQPNAADAKAWHNPAAPTRFAHDFSRIPLYSKAPIGLQAKLKVNAPGDSYEQEADRIAEQVVSMPERKLQRACACDDTGCSGCKNKKAANERLQAKRVGANDHSETTAPPIVYEVLHSSGQPLDASVREFMESRFGHDFSGVRVHADDRAAESARVVAARAYTVGQHVVFGSGQNATGTNEGRKLLAHELTHVLQQRGASSSLTRERRQTAGSSSLQRQVFGASATKVSNPKAIIPVGKFIEYVEAVERAYANDSPQEIVTRIRQQYYSGLAFDMLIPGAHTHDTRIVETDFKPITVTERRGIDSRIGSEAFSHLTAMADENDVGDNPSPYVQLASGEKADIGHFLLGLDALLHPQESEPYTSYGVPNIDPSSYVADLGIASVWMTQHEETGKPPDDAPRKLASPDLNTYYQMSAPAEDLLGDVESFGVNAQAMSASGQTLSQTLRAYYLGSANQAAGTKKRWRTFCAKNNFTFEQSGTTINWSPTVRANLALHVNRFSDLYAAGKFGAVYGAVTSPTRRNWPHTDAVVNRFLDWVKTNLEKEIAAN